MRKERYRTQIKFVDDGKPVRIPDNDVGFFFSDEVFVVLKTFMKNAKIHYSIHFWIGKDKSDTDADLRHQNVHKGSLNDVFNASDPKAFKPKLLHFCLNKWRHRTEMYEVPISWKSLTSNDVFIYDEGTKMTQWNGSRCDEEERQAARQYITSALKRRNCRAFSEFYDEEELFEKNELHSRLGDADVPPVEFKRRKQGFQKTMLRLSDQSGKLVLTKIYSGKIYRDGINEDDVTFIEDLNLLYVYIGPGASATESLGVWVEAEKYLKSVGRPDKAIAVFTAGSYLPSFNEIWNDQRMHNRRRYM
ncbi:unnamed protein product [Dibothriocephalus latus]|uniref:Gelsolin-like domain-containing protein n=1 Tax=Dibothriocephalus latus TaxID=60516 RepID=A0A3P6TT40_DIBLA|nr:unnamed protein product [Dibothriocephalus latus]